VTGILIEIHEEWVTGTQEISKHKGKKEEKIEFTEKQLLYLSPQLCGRS
jgi:hypothetical protein